MHTLTQSSPGTHRSRSHALICEWIPGENTSKLALEAQDLQCCQCMTQRGLPSTDWCMHLTWSASLRPVTTRNQLSKNTCSNIWLIPKETSTAHVVIVFLVMNLGKENHWCSHDFSFKWLVSSYSPSYKHLVLLKKQQRGRGRKTGRKGGVRSRSGGRNTSPQMPGWTWQVSSASAYHHVGRVVLC